MYPPGLFHSHASMDLAIMQCIVSCLGIVVGVVCHMCWNQRPRRRRPRFDGPTDGRERLCAPIVSGRYSSMYDCLSIRLFVGIHGHSGRFINTDKIVVIGQDGNARSSLLIGETERERDENSVQRKQQMKSDI